MTTSLFVSATAHHPQTITPVEQERLREDIDRVLLATPAGGDQKVIDRKKDIRKRFNRVGETLSHFLVHSYNHGQPIAKPLVTAIGDFFSARTQKIQRRLSALFAIETKEDGELDLAEMIVAQGDLSHPALVRLLTEIDDNLSVLQEMRAAVVSELQKPERQS